VSLVCWLRGHDMRPTAPLVLRCRRCLLAVRAVDQPRFVAKGELSPSLRLLVLRGMAERGTLGKTGRGGDG
jgi:hypothetical protein